jgi:hypothetical protein
MTDSLAIRFGGGPELRCRKTSWLLLCAGYRHKKEPQAGYAPWGVEFVASLGFWGGRHNIGGWGVARPGLIERHVAIR